MKIIEQGQKQQPAPAEWWVGRVLTCPTCRCRFELEAGDPVIPYAARCWNCPPEAMAICPTCGGKITTSYKPTVQLTEG